MTSIPAEYDLQPPMSQPGNGDGPTLDMTHWGYAISDGKSGQGLRTVIAALGRFSGAILLMAAVGLWILPDSVQSGDLFGMKLAAMVAFTLVGGYALWAGRRPRHLEFQIDTLRGQLRIGNRSFQGVFNQKAAVEFADVASVFLLRSKDRSQPARLFLRLAYSDGAIEIANGSQAQLEKLRDRLARDLAGNPRRPVEFQHRPRPGIAA